MLEVETLQAAIAHLQRFRANLYDEDEVDVESGLRAADLDIVLAAAERQLESDRLTAAG
ncbi:hypothetical protein [uncultured Sphingomonas sp.]|uniref:hypothetical protein n=1 Tax=uncultured Sphingomonas sp. TaxID=158754 RepID=UPI0025D7B5B0|nr:hypothetical protein [uncultured Sphingomonas sp.]